MAPRAIFRTESSSEALWGIREDTLGQSRASYTLARSSPAVISGLSRQEGHVGRCPENELSQALHRDTQDSRDSCLSSIPASNRLNLQVSSNVYSRSPWINSRVLLGLKRSKKNGKDKGFSEDWVHYQMQSYPPGPQASLQEWRSVRATAHYRCPTEETKKL